MPETNRALTLRQKCFIDYYLDPTGVRVDERGIEHRTFGNASQSYAKALDRPADQTARTEGARNLTKPHIKSEIETLAEMQGIGVKVRLGLLGAIAKNQQASKRTRKRKYAYRTVDGKRRRYLSEEIVTDEEPKAGERVKAVAVLNKMTGLDAAQEAVKEVALREYRELKHRITGLGQQKRPKSQ